MSIFHMEGVSETPLGWTLCRRKPGQPTSSVVASTCHAMETCPECYQDTLVVLGAPVPQAGVDLTAELQLELDAKVLLQFLPRQTS